MRSLRRRLWFLLLFFSPAFLLAQDEQTLEFLKGSERPIVDNVRDTTITSIALLPREFEAVLASFGKAPPLSDRLLAKLKAKDRALHQQARNIKTALKLTQGEQTFYLRALDSARLSKLRVGGRVKCRAVLIALRTEAGVLYVPLIQSVEPL